MGATAIEWTDQTWNPVSGCTKVSEGCRHCYAKTLHDQRHKAFKEGKKIPLQYAEPFEKVQLMPDRLTDPLHWKKPRRVFVNSVSDLFHKDVPDEFLDRTFAVMGLTGQHTYQVLTKRADRMEAYLARLAKSVAPLEAAAREMGHTFKFTGLDGKEHGLLPWPIRNVWLGVSVESQAAADERIPHLLRTPAAVRFLSCEPLLGPVDLSKDETVFFCNACGKVTAGVNGDCAACGDPRTRERRYIDYLDWVIVGGESGHGARPMHVEWARSLVKQCKAAGVACFVKQLGADPRMTFRDVCEIKSNPPAVDCHPDTVGPVRLRDRKGGDIEEFPADLRVREFPEPKVLA